ncbi:hypothetical protein DWB61_02795 [Ancylomarina euxinus]|uniref:Uncharacterized protein n=1 Tax=Ancylomarina euxinus TaxID=2283627 RepID=A0A425Y6L2_9BACT|nr:hypothetical protein [Ancylomarina euxinus]MCZ4694069.1 hypothetical protein [Ancylomarina euxinus]MUP14511.1 hypothetical protein [Ancylomarina euxinus]RRG24061.1 hypothetical protein DWB61_02795 [Ancylomarina euxinus]
MFNLISKLKENKSLWPYFFEFLTVLLSVYLAFLITEWRENHKEEIETKLAKERLNQEIFQNYKNLINFNHQVEKRLIKMQDIEDILESGYKFNDYIPVFNGFQNVSFSDASWNRICDSKIGNLMPVVYIEDAHALYNFNKHLMTHNNQIIELMYSDLNFDSKKSKIAYNIAELYVWQQASWGNIHVVDYTKFIQKHKTNFETLLQQDSTTNAYFTSKDILTEEQWTQEQRGKQRYINSFKKNPKLKEILSKIKASKS